MRDKVSLQFILQVMFVFWFLTISPESKAQQVVIGRITEANDGTPVPGAAIFIANTTIGTTSDELGYYALTVQGEGSYEIVVSHVGYRPVFHKINTPESFHHINFALDTNEIAEVIITPCGNYRKKDVDLFWRRLLGEKPSKRGMEILNPENVYFCQNGDKVLNVSCKEPIKIVNHETGYHIRYVLESFQHDYRTDESTIYGKPYFEELIPQNSHQNLRWEKKRQEVYAVSLTRFLRALYRGQIHEEGFLLAKRDAFSLKDILQVELHRVHVNIGDPLLLACFSKPVTDKMIQNAFSLIYGINGKIPFMTLLPQQFILYSDGTYTGLLKIHEHRSPITGLSSMLPVEYRATLTQDTEWMINSR